VKRAGLLLAVLVAGAGHGAPAHAGLKVVASPVPAATPSPAARLVLLPSASAFLRHEVKGAPWGHATMTVYGDGRMAIDKLVRGAPTTKTGKLSPDALMAFRMDVYATWPRYPGLDPASPSPKTGHDVRFTTSEGLLLVKTGADAESDPYFTRLAAAFAKAEQALSHPAAPAAPAVEDEDAEGDEDDGYYF
jgi:hypothetical protein